MRVTDFDIAGRPRPGDVAKVCVPLTSVLTDELDEAQRSLGVATEELLLAAFGRTIARTIGEGVVSVDFTDGAHAASALTLRCSTVHATSADEMLAEVHRELETAPGHGTGIAEVLISYRGSAPEVACFDHALEIRIYRDGGVVHLDWRYDSRQFASYAVQELTEQFPLALIELTSEATPAFVDNEVTFAAFGV
ncbi:polyketide synthase [soil metagenome]